MPRKLKKAELKQVPDDVVVCINCAGHSQFEGDRFEEFLRPHWKSCRINEAMMGDIFIWKKVKEQK